MYRHQGHGFAINRSKKKFGGSFKGIDEGGGILKLAEGLCQNFLWFTFLGFNAHT